MKRKAQALTLIMIVSFFVAYGVQLVNLTKANPNSLGMPTFVKEGEGSPPEGTSPIQISITSPENNTAYASNNVTLTFNANVSEYQTKIYYIASWQESKKTYINLNSPKYNLPHISINITNLPEGPRWLEVHAVQERMQITRTKCDTLFPTIYYLSYEVTGSSMVNFTIDTTPPEVSIPSLKNKTYSTSTIPLNFITNERISQSTYSLDGQENVTTTGNTTLTGLANGDHNLTIYAKDEAGNTGVSEIIYFNVEVPFPTALIIASVVSVAIIGAGLLVYFKKRKH